MPCNVRSVECSFTAVKRDKLNARQFLRKLPCMYCKDAENHNFTALQSMQGILHITALQPCEFLPLRHFSIVHCYYFLVFVVATKSVAIIKTHLTEKL